MTLNNQIITHLDRVTHLDLFSGIGGFAYAAQQVWGEAHRPLLFCDIEPFAQKVIAKHWPDVPIIEDIREVTLERLLVADALRSRHNEAQNRIAPEQDQNKQKDRVSQRNGKHARAEIHLLTGGFPCQPFSHAGKRRGREDNRFLWPEMLRVIRETKPRWVIGENVYGLLNIEAGMVFEQACSELEGEGYEVWPVCTPACGVDAPHKRERIWIVGRAKFLAHPLSNTKGGSYRGESRECERGWEEQNRSERNEVGCDTPDRSQDVADTNRNGTERNQPENREGCGVEQRGQDVADSTQELFNRSGGSRPAGGSEYTDRRVIEGFKRTSRKSSWLPEPDVGRVAHGIPSRVDRLKGLGNAIVPQQVIPIMETIAMMDLLK